MNHGIIIKRGKRKVKGVPPSNAVCLPLYQEKAEIDKKTNKSKSNKRTKITKVSSLFPKRGNHNAKGLKKRKNKITQGNASNKSPRRINHKATKSKTNTGTPN